MAKKFHPLNRRFLNSTQKINYILLVNSKRRFYAGTYSTYISLLAARKEIF